MLQQLHLRRVGAWRCKYLFSQNNVLLVLLRVQVRIMYFLFLLRRHLPCRYSPV